MGRAIILALLVVRQITCGTARRVAASVTSKQQLDSQYQLVLNQSLVVWQTKWDGKEAASGDTVGAGVDVFKSGLEVLKGKGDQEALGDTLTNIGLLVLALAPADPSFTCLIVGGVLAGTGALISVFADGGNSTMDALKEGFRQVGVELDELKKQIANVHEDIAEMRGDVLELKNQDLEAYLAKTRSNYKMFIESLQYAKPADQKALSHDLLALSKGLEMDEYKTSPHRIETYLSDIMRINTGYRGYAMAAWKFQAMLGARLERFGLCMPAALSGRGLFMFVNMCTGHLEEDLIGYQSYLSSSGLEEWIRAPKVVLNSYINQDHALHTTVTRAISELSKNFWFERPDDHSARCYEGDAVPEKAVKELARIGAPAAADAIPELRRALFHACWSVYRNALKTIVSIGRPAASYAIGDLRRIISDTETIAARAGPSKFDNLVLRQEAASAIAEIGGPAADDAIPDLVWCLQNDKSHRVRLSCAFAIGEIGGSAAAEALPELRKAAAEEGLDVRDGGRSVGMSYSQFSMDDLRQLKEMVVKMEASKQTPESEVFDV